MAGGTQPRIRRVITQRLFQWRLKILGDATDAGSGKSLKLGLADSLNRAPEFKNSGQRTGATRLQHDIQV